MSHQRRRGVAFLLAFGILAAACGDDDAAVAPVPGGTGDDAGDASDGEGSSGSPLNISADDIAFDTDRLDVTTGEETTVIFDNADEGIQHNFHVQAGDVDVETDITAGPVTQELTFTIDEPGDYTFICDVHPDQMTGDLVVS